MSETSLRGKIDTKLNNHSNMYLSFNIHAHVGPNGHNAKYPYQPMTMLEILYSISSSRFKFVVVHGLNSVEYFERNYDAQELD